MAFSYDFRYDDNLFETDTSLKQIEVEDSIARIYAKHIRQGTLQAGLLRSTHEQFIRDSIHGLSSGFTVLDASQPWLAFWCLNSLDILGCDASEFEQQALDTMVPHESGGFCGGFKQLPHMAGTYASIMALVLVGTKRAFDLVDRKATYRWLMSMKQADGSFAMHLDGEVDVRGVYCAMVIASVLNIMTPELVAGSAEFIVRCQTCEGGIGPYPGVEAHGGYTLCGLAALDILNKTQLLDLQRLARWISSRQLAFEGGFNGRTNKLVDGCYSYWMGGACSILQKALKQDWLYEPAALQRYVLVCCQDKKLGGLLDKPGKSADLYHTMVVVVLVEDQNEMVLTAVVLEFVELVGLALTVGLELALMAQAVLALKAVQYVLAKNEYILQQTVLVES
ncbi:CAAX farnesyltransferase (FTase) subunit beta [Coemansia sp. RSA 990]|nr:CAAX farnesyltransferase (FTase) subunit beta [Coemansia sp. RSA 1086]KAJ1870874.1 CAAX farnesyltransferase (FTase) subunit beta [Coemansia sp. RSA 990]KAJ2672721.1 CAAX farnesyltransferase (FTase) subunit beta [Coemansia sp. RSA 1085]